MAAANQWGARAMFKLTLCLCAGLFAAMYLGGTDRGQQRFGLMEQPHDKVTAAVVTETPAVAPLPAPAPEIAPVTLTEAAFVPEAPLMVAPAVAESAAPVTEEATGLLMVVNTKSVNVREGPGKDFSVVDRLVRGESVLVVVQGEGPDGWSLIRIEGDGVEGYVASRLLTE